MALIGGAIALSNTFHSYATFDPSWLEENSGNGNLDEVTETAQGFFSSLYNLVGVMCAAVAVFCLILIGLKFMRGGRHTEQAKDDALNWLIGGALIFGAVSAVSLVSGVFN